MINLLLINSTAVSEEFFCNDSIDGYKSSNNGSKYWL